MKQLLAINAKIMEGYRLRNYLSYIAREHKGGTVNGYRRRILSEMHSIFSDIEPSRRALDVGAGDGWFAASVERLGISNRVLAIDVKARSQYYHSVEIYTDSQLPFVDHEYDLVYAIDVIHHAEEPDKLLAEMARCTRRYLLLKDHTWNTKFAWLVLAARDEAGNRRFGVRCPYRYQRGWEWDTVLEGAGMKRVRLIYPLVCHWGPLSRLVNATEFLSLWERVAPATTVKKD